MSKLLTTVLMIAFVYSMVLNPIVIYNRYLQISNSVGINVYLMASNVYVMAGQISYSDCEYFQTVVRYPSSRTTVILESPGGNYLEGLCIADFVKRNNITTVVTTTGQYTSSPDIAPIDDVPFAGLCASACSYIFVAGKERRLIGDVRFGIHNPGRPSELLKYFTKRDLEYRAFESAGVLSRALTRYGVKGADLRKKFFEVKHEGIYWLDPDDFIDHPQYKTIATEYIDFWGYSEGEVK